MTAAAVKVATQRAQIRIAHRLRRPHHLRHRHLQAHPRAPQAAARVVAAVNQIVMTMDEAKRKNLSLNNINFVSLYSFCFVLNN